MKRHTVYLYLLSPLHTGGAAQEGNLLGIARESHTDLPYVPSSTLRGRFRAATEDEDLRKRLWGNTIDDLRKPNASEDKSNSNQGNQRQTDNNLTQGDLWVGDASILWIPVVSLSHGVIWVSCPLLLQRWARFNAPTSEIPTENCTNLAIDKPVYLKDAIFKAGQLTTWSAWQEFVPEHDSTQGIQNILVLPNQHCATLVQMSLWRQVKIKLDSHKTVDGGFRYEEAIPPDTLMYLSWGLTNQASQSSASTSEEDFEHILTENDILQIGGQESLGRGFVQQWLSKKQIANQAVTA